VQRASLPVFGLRGHVRAFKAATCRRTPNRKRDSGLAIDIVNNGRKLNQATMKTTGTVQTPVMKRFGARGARVFGWVWFSAMNLGLIAIVTGWWMASSEIPGGWRRMVAGCIVGSLTVLAASLLARMRLKYFGEIEGV
jgi:hypothetical protein